MIAEAKCLIAFAGPSINLRERSSDFWPIESVLRFRSQLDGALAFGDRRIFLTESGKNLTKYSTPTGILRTFAHQPFCTDPRSFHRRLRVYFGPQVWVKRTFAESFWASRGTVARQCLFR